jgi:SagB-type dehydrogenase family enzyme
VNVSPRTLAEVVYGDRGVSVDDLAEQYHEASKAYPSFLGREIPGLARLEADPVLQRIVARSVRRHPSRPQTALPESHPLTSPLAAILGARRSRRDLDGYTLSLQGLGSILHAAYGVTHSGPQALRSVPSGGALYPLELYVAARAVSDLPVGLYHYDPLRHVLERLARGDLDDRLRPAMVYPELLDAAALVVVTAVFWRTRFKYGLRGYRFALLEAGHVMQNALLACTALSIPAVPVGGFYDRLLEAVLGIDGVNESAVYGVALGGDQSG